MRSPDTDLVVERLSGAGIAPFLPELARLRIAVFREFPYLYEGSLQNERRYLREFASSPHAVLVIARSRAEVVGASTAVPLREHGDAAALSAPFRAAGIDPESVFYFGESVLVRARRGRGLGNAFFAEREAAAREQGFRMVSFCAVERPPDHPARPADYVPHDAFWTRRGYTRRDDMIATFSWRDVGEAHETEKPMVLWLKELTS